MAARPGKRVVASLLYYAMLAFRVTHSPGLQDRASLLAFLLGPQRLAPAFPPFLLLRTIDVAVEAVQEPHASRSRVTHGSGLRPGATPLWAL